MRPTEDANVRMAREHFAAESAHDHERTLATLADDVIYRVVAAGVTLRGKAAVARYYDLWWKAFPRRSDRVAASRRVKALRIGACVAMPAHGGLAALLVDLADA